MNKKGIVGLGRQRYPYSPSRLSPIVGARFLNEAQKIRYGVSAKLVIQRGESKPKCRLAVRLRPWKLDASLYPTCPVVS